MTIPLARIPQLFPIKETAEKLKVSTKTVRRLIAAGEFRTHRVGSQIRICEEDLIGYIAKSRR
jgi:excisionase family DNA binding protein